MRTIASQRLPASVLADSIDKPWRPVPSKRCTADESRRLLLWVIAVSFALSSRLGTIGEFLVLAVSTWMYNDLGGADQGSWIRNSLNVAGLSSLYYGATAIAIDRAAAGTGLTGWMWIAVLVAVQLTMGEKMRDGQDLKRWIMADLIIACSFLWPRFLGVGSLGYVAPMLLGIILAGRIAGSRSETADRVSWKLGYWWMAVMGVLPACRVIGMAVSRLHWWLWIRYTPDDWLREHGYI